MNQETFIAIFAVAAIAGFVAFMLYKRKNKGTSHEAIHAALSGVGIGKHLANFTVTTKSPGGVNIQSTVPVPAASLDLIDEGILNQIARHNLKYPHWDKYKELSEYSVLFVEPMATNVETSPGSPALVVRPGIQTAGTCIGVSPGTTVDRPFIVLPHQEKQKWSHTDYLMRSAWHESEHVRELNDYNVFLQYANAGDIHPHVTFDGE